MIKTMQSLVNVLKNVIIETFYKLKNLKVLNQLLLHNTYIREDIDDFRVLYEQCEVLF